MEEYIRVVNENGITKVYYKLGNHTEEVLFHELKDGDAVRICIGNEGKLASLNEKYLGVNHKYIG